MKTIPLTQSKVALVDDQDYEEVSKYRWQALRTKHTFYATRFTSRTIGRQYIYMHRQILGLMLGDKREGDHGDGDGLNNQRYNLRLCTRLQNSHNLRTQRRPHKQSKYKGVKWHNQLTPWQARITINGRVQSLGYHATQEKAALAYNEAAKIYFRDFAKLNLIEV